MTPEDKKKYGILPFDDGLQVGDKICAWQKKEIERLTTTDRSIEMQGYEQRVVDEQTELNEKLVKLIQFTTTATYRKLTVEEMGLLEEQQHAMTHYNQILSKRIAKFLPSEF